MLPIISTEVLSSSHWGSEWVTQELLALMSSVRLRDCCRNSRSLINISPGIHLFYISISNPFPELRFMVSWRDHLCDVVRVSALLLQTPQSHHPEGHEEKNYDRQLRLPRRWVEPDLWDGQGHRSQVGLFLLRSGSLLTLFLHRGHFYSLLSSAAVRLLKVKPEERLTIEGVLAHPWLNCTEALDNVLPSAQMMMDKVTQPSAARRDASWFKWHPMSFQAVVAGIQQAHAEQLANMRIQDLNISLKPLNSVNNPILRKRKLLGYDGILQLCTANDIKFSLFTSRII